MYRVNDNQADYKGVEKAKIGVMKSLTSGTVKFKNLSPKKLGEGFGGYLKPRRDINALSVVDDYRVHDAILYKTNNHKKSLLPSNLRKDLPRDMMMYKTTDMFNNI